MRTHLLKGRKREDQAGELGNAAHCKQGLTCWRGGRGRSGLVRIASGGTMLAVSLLRLVMKVGLLIDFREHYILTLSVVGVGGWPWQERGTVHV